jgi:uncharacterized protein YdaU (DUF1376 family)
MYPSDFEAKTSHLTLLEDGAYNRLLRLCWMTPGCSIPADEAWIMRRVRARDEAEIDAVRTVLGEFFRVIKGRYSNARLTREFIAATEAHEKRKKAGSKGGLSKSLKTNESGPSNAIAKPKQPEPEPEQEPEKKEEDTSVSSKKERGSRLPDDWVLPRDWGEWAVEQGLEPAAVHADAERFRDYWIAKAGREATKLNWQATWRNWIRSSIERNPRKAKSNAVSDAKRIADIYRSKRGMDCGPDQGVAVPLLSAGR